MQWVRYEELIIDKYGVVLDGWPFPKLEVEGLGLRDLEFLLQKIQKNEIMWRKLTAEEIQSHKTELAQTQMTSRGKKHRPHSNKGKKKGAYSNKAYRENDRPRWRDNHCHVQGRPRRHSSDKSESDEEHDIPSSSEKLSNSTKSNSHLSHIDSGSEV